MIQPAPSGHRWPPGHLIMYSLLLLIIQPAPACQSWPPGHLIVYSWLLLMKQSYSRLLPVIAGLLAISLSSAGFYWWYMAISLSTGYSWLLLMIQPAPTGETAGSYWVDHSWPPGHLIVHSRLLLMIQLALADHSWTPGQGMVWREPVRLYSACHKWRHSRYKHWVFKCAHKFTYVQKVDGGKGN